MAQSARKKLSVMTLALMTVAAVVSLRGLPMMATEGLSMLFYIGFCTIFFLIPASLVSAELGGAFADKQGGIYTWVSEAFGSRWGFVAIWLQWIQNVVWYPTVLAFAAGALAYLFLKPDLASAGWYNTAVILVVYWAANFMTLMGADFAARMTKWFMLLGTVLPGLLIIGLGIAWVAQGNSVEFLETTDPTGAGITGELAHARLFPHITGLSTIAFLAGIILLFAGIEVQAVHANDMENPSREYPRSMFVAAIIIFVLFTLGALAVATVVPAREISLTAGLMQAFESLLDKFGLKWMTPIAGLLVAFGAIGGVMAWIGGPSRGLLQTAQEGEIPPFLAKTNAKGVQVSILIVQGAIVSALALIYLLFKDVSVAFFVLSAMTVTLYLVMYMLMYAAAIYLRKTRSDLPRSYEVPGGMGGMWAVAGGGFAAVLFAFIVGFVPPAQLEIGSPEMYFGLVGGGLVVFIGLPLLIHAFKKPSWRQAAAGASAPGSTAGKSASSPRIGWPPAQGAIRSLRIPKIQIWQESTMALHTTDTSEPRNDVLDDAYASSDLQKELPKTVFPASEENARHVYDAIHDELMLDGNSRQNLATFCTAWMEPEVRDLMAETVDKNMIDKDEYPQTAAIEQRCVHLIADLWNAPDSAHTIGCSTTGSSEAAMLGGMAMKWRWRDKRRAEGKPTDKPNLICGPVQVCWHKFCRYWDVEIREIPMEGDRLLMTPEEVLKRCDENTIGVVPTLGVTFTGQYEPVADVCAALDKLQQDKGLDIPVHVDGASGGFLAPFCDPDLMWDFRLDRVVSINASGHKFGLAPLGVGWIIWRDKEHLPKDLIFDVNYLGGNMPTFALNFSRPGGEIICQYYNFIRLGREGYRKIQNACYETAQALAKAIEQIGPFDILYDGNGGIPAVCWSMKEGAEVPYTLFDLADRLRTRGWLVPAYSLPPHREDLAIQRILVKHGFGRDMAMLLIDDMKRAIDHLTEHAPKASLEAKDATVQDHSGR